MTNPIQKTVIVEISLLRALAQREHYDNYYSYVVHERLLKETQTLLDAYKEYYILYPEHTEIEWGTFLTQFCTNWHAQDMHQEDIDFFRGAILQIKDSVSEDAEAALLGLINKQFMDQLIKIGDKPFTSDHIRSALDVYEIKRAGVQRDYDKDCFTSDSVDFATIDKSLGLSYALPPLQDALGGMVPGSLVVLNAASGIGKSAFIHTQLVHTFKQLNNEKSSSPILFFNTEGPLSEVFARFWSCLYKDKCPDGYREIMRKQASIQQSFDKYFNKNLLLGFMANYMGLNFIRMKIKKYKPALVVLDMAAGIMTPMNKNSSDVGNLEGYFNALRKLSSETCPIIASVQAGAGAKWFDKEDQKMKYKQWPTDDDIYGSRTAVQGAAETIITIGRDNEHDRTRYIQTTKTKSLTTAKFICEIEPKFSYYKLVNTVSTFNGDKS